MLPPLTWGGSPDLEGGHGKRRKSQVSARRRQKGDILKTRLGQDLLISRSECQDNSASVTRTRAVIREEELVPLEGLLCVLRIE